MPGYTFGYFGLKRLGRRITVCITLVVSGVALMADALLSHYALSEDQNVKNANLATFLIGKSFAAN